MFKSLYFSSAILSMPASTTIDPASLIQVAEGNETAFRELFDAFRDKVYSIGMHLTQNEMLAEDIVQEVFTKVWENREQLREVQYIKSWLRVITRNTCINHLRALATERSYLDKFTSEQKGEAFQDNSIIDREYEQILQSAIQTLPPQQQRVYLLSRQDGMKNEQIAHTLGISIYTVKEHLKRALGTIRATLEKRMDIAVMIALAIYFE